MGKAATDPFATRDRPIAPLADALVAISETPSFVGRAVVALAQDPDVSRWNGKSLLSGQWRGIAEVRRVPAWPSRCLNDAAVADRRGVAWGRAARDAVRGGAHG